MCRISPQVLHDLAVRVGWDLEEATRGVRKPRDAGVGRGDGGAPAVPLTSRCDLNSSRTTTLGPRWLLSVAVWMMAGLVFSSSNWILFFFFTSSRETANSPGARRASLQANKSLRWTGDERQWDTGNTQAHQTGILDSEAQLLLVYFIFYKVPLLLGLRNFFKTCKWGFN